MRVLLNASRRLSGGPRRMALTVLLLLSLGLTGSLPACRPASPPTPPPATGTGPGAPAQPSDPTRVELERLVVTQPARDLGNIEIKVPEREALVDFFGVGYAPLNQVWLLMADGFSRPDAQAIASGWGAAIVGEIELLAAYQLEVAAGSAEALVARLAEAQAMEQVHLALPNLALPVSTSATVTIEECNPTANANYEGELGRPYQMIGLKDAWTMVQASGLTVHEVQVGVVDAAAWGRSPEVNQAKGPFMRGLSLSDVQGPPLGDGPIDDGTHGTAVTHTIAADHRVGGAIGVASILGEQLKVSVSNVFDPRMPDAQRIGPVPPGAREDDFPDQVIFRGHAYALDSIAQLQLQIEAGATIINCSYGPLRPTTPLQEEWMAACNRAHARFLQFVEELCPEVLVVAAAGNDNSAILPETDYFGHARTNMMTIGALDLNGSRAAFSNFMGEPAQLEVSLGAPGVGIVSHVAADGSSQTTQGTSFASPIVAGAAAILRSLKPDLTAAELKQILVETAATTVRSADDKASTPVPANVGGRILRVDNAVLRVVNMVRREAGQPELSRAELLAMGAFEVKVSGGPEQYQVAAALKGAEAGPVKLTLRLIGSEAEPPADATQTATAQSTAAWTLRRSKDAGPYPIVATVTRDDNGRCQRLTLAPPKDREAWDITACTRGYFELTSSFAGLLTSTVIGSDPQGPPKVVPEPRELAAQAKPVRPGHSGSVMVSNTKSENVVFPGLEWKGLEFAGVYQYDFTPTGLSYGTPEPYQAEMWVRGRVSAQHDRVEWVEVGVTHPFQLSRPATNLATWTSDAPRLEWSWRAEDVPLKRDAILGWYTNLETTYGNDVGGAPSASRVTRFDYREQTLAPHEPTRDELQRGTSSFHLRDHVAKWAGGAEGVKHGFLSVRFELPEDWAGR